MDGRGPHLVLVGLMGVGKTTVGRALARRLERPFVDTDALVEAAAGLPVARIFAEEGEAAFRARERDAVRDACASPDPLVIACGGGAMADPDSRRRARAAGMVVWLRAAPAVLGARVGDARSRPLLAGSPAGSPVGSPGSSPAATLDRLAALRDPAYAAVADVEIPTDTRTVDEVVAAVLEELSRWSE